MSILLRKTNFLDLSSGVISTIVSFLPRRDACRLLEVCKRIRSIAEKCLLSKIVLVSRRQTARFCAFMLAALATRARCLRDLELRSGAFGISARLRDVAIHKTDLSQIDALSAIITHAADLQRLHISCVEWLLTVRPGLGKALQRSRGLVEVGLTDGGSRALALVGRMRSRPRKLVFSRLTYGADTTLFATTSPATRLEDVSFSNLCGLLTNETSETSGGAPCATWPNVRRLSLRDSVASLSACASAFPNVEELRLRRVSNEPEEAARSIRWKALRRVEGHSLDFARWRIRCPVQCVELQGVHGAQQDCDCLLTAMSDMSPVVLSFDVPTMAVRGFWYRFSRPGAASARLRSLSLVLREDPTDPKFSKWMNDVPRLLGGLKLVCLRICIVNVLAEQRDPSVAETIVQKLPALLARALPRLKYIALAIPAGHFDEGARYVGPFSWWQSRVTGYKRVARPIPTYVGEQISKHFEVADVKTIAKMDDGRFFTRT